MNTSFASLIDTQIVDVELGVRLVEEVALLELELDLPARQLLVEGRPARDLLVAVRTRMNNNEY